MNKYQLTIGNETNPYNVKTRSIFIKAKSAAEAERVANKSLKRNEEITDIEWVAGSTKVIKKKHGRIIGRKVK